MSSEFGLTDELISGFMTMNEGHYIQMSCD